MTHSADLHPTWQTPPEPIAHILDAPPIPATSVSPTGQWLLELEQPSLCPIADLAEPELGLAGFRLNPQTHGPARPNTYRRLRIQDLKTGTAQSIELPDDARLHFLKWSPDGQKIAFTLIQPNGLELWFADLTTAQAQRVTEPILNGTYGTPYRWFSNDAFLCKVIPADRGAAPIESTLPIGPSIQENLGRKTPTRTYTNLLETPHDEMLLEYYITSALEKITLSGTRLQLVAPQLIDEAELSPDGQYILFSTVHRPFSYQVPSARFPKKIEVLDATGKLVYQLADLPLDDQRSIKFDAVRSGPRQVSWRSDRPATLHWVEALDGGDPAQQVPHRDRLVELNAPFTGDVIELWRSQFRFRAVRWGRDDAALVWEQEYDSRTKRIWRLYPNQPEKSPALLVEGSTEDQYSDRGNPLFVLGQYQRYVLQFAADSEHVFFKGRGASPQGVYPFLDRMNITTGETDRIWQCQDPYYEDVIEVYDANANQILTRRQSQTEPPNVFLRNTKDNDLGNQITHYADPAPQLANVQREVVKYERSDGVTLSANLYLPAGYDPQEEGPLPTMFWVYPAEFKKKELAGQVTTAENTFSRPSRSSVLFLLTQGYAVLDDPTLPIIGEGDQEPNDTYVEQLIAGAEAAVNYMVDRGISDRDRIGIGGHSYGAFTTANLLAHTRLFQLGIARSGAYNRTLTPFGFQGEQRNYWEAMETYNQMAPFTHAAQIKAPLLLIHGANDSNPGTYPIQTERLYEALKGLGATVRWVELPLEDHGYRSREAVGHVLWEMVRWCDLYLKA